ncbi:MAG TPA: hypothetical protein VIM22_11590 [Solirubrobacteraceae bacterium]
MSADAKIMLLFVGLHLLGIGFVAMLLVMFVRSETVKPWTPPDDGDGGGGGSDRVPPRRPGEPGGGGLPLSDSEPARARLRYHRRLADLLPKRERRPAREPAPARTPART